MKKANRKPISARTRFEVLKRDQFSCQYCGAKAPEVILHIDHVMPVAEGGGNEILNLITACAACNMGKSDKKISDDSAVKKQLKQASELEEILQQKKLMARWIEDLKKASNHDINFVVNYIGEHYSVYLTEQGSKIIAKLIAKYGLKEVIECVELSANNYLKCRDNEENINLFFDKIGRICACRERDKKDPEGAEVRRIASIAGRIWYGHTRWILEKNIKKIYDAGYSFSEIERIARSVKTVTAFLNSFEVEL